MKAWLFFNYPAKIWYKIQAHEFYDRFWVGFNDIFMYQRVNFITKLYLLAF